MEQGADRTAPRGFLNFLAEATAEAPEDVLAIVNRTLTDRNFHKTREFYEIRNGWLLDSLVDSITLAARDKLRHDSEHHKLGHTSLETIIKNAVAFALLAGAHLAKDKKL